MPIPSQNISTQTLLAEFYNTDIHDIPFTYFFDNVNIWSRAKFYNRNLNSYQLTGYTHGLYRDANKQIGYNGGNRTNISMSDLIGYNHNGFSPSFFDIGSIVNGNGFNVFDPLGWTFYVGQNYTITGQLYLSEEILPNEVSNYTKPNKSTTSGVYGGLSFGISTGTTITDSTKVFSNTEVGGQEISFSVRFSNTNKNNEGNLLDIFYCQRSGTSYNVTDYPIENAYWDSLAYVSFHPFLIWNRIPFLIKMDGEDYSYPYFSHLFQNSANNTNIDDYVSFKMWIVLEDNTVMYPVGCGVMYTDEFGNEDLGYVSVNYDELTGTWTTTDIIYGGDYLKIEYSFANALYDEDLPANIKELHIFCLDSYGGGVEYEMVYSAPYWDYSFDL